MIISNKCVLFVLFFRLKNACQWEPLIDLTKMITNHHQQTEEVPGQGNNSQQMHQTPLDPQTLPTEQWSPFLNIAKETYRSRNSRELV